MHRRWIAPAALLAMFVTAAAVRVWLPPGLTTAGGLVGVRSLAAMLLFPVSGVILLAIFAALARAAPDSGDRERTAAIWTRVANAALLLHLVLHLSLVVSALR